MFDSETKSEMDGVNELQKRLEAKLNLRYWSWYAVFRLSTKHE